MGIFFNTQQTEAQRPQETSVTATATPKTDFSEPTTVGSFLGNVQLDSGRLNPMTNVDLSTLQYISLEDGKNQTTGFGYIPSRSASDDILFGTGATYLTGLSLGGAYGALEGLRSTKGSPFKIRFNGLLNGCTRRGPFIGNSFGVLALGYTSVNSLLVYSGAPDSKITSIGAGVLTGMMFKSTAGLRSSLITGAICGTAIGIWKLANEQF